MDRTMTLGDSLVGSVQTKAVTALPVVGLLLGLLFHLAVAQDALANPGDLDQTFGTGGRVMVDAAAGGVFSSSAAVLPDGKIVVGGACITSAATSTDFCLARYHSDGSLDISFGVGGRVSTAFVGASFDTINALALQQDGKIVAVGQSEMSFALARYHSDGTLDAAFGLGGRVITSFGTFFDIPRDVAIQPDGKIVAVGSSSTGLFMPAKFALARYSADGSLDATFGNGGKVTTNFGIDTSDGAASVALQSDGKIVVAGTTNSRVFSATTSFGVARYMTDGSLDLSFGGTGMVATDFGGRDEAAAIVVQPDGNIVVGGTSTSDTGSGSDTALARYTPDGALDPTFGTGGRTLPNLGNKMFATSLALQSNGKVVVAGRQETEASGPLPFPVPRFMVARYSSTGTPDTSFGIDGRVITDFDGQGIATAVAIQPDGKIVAVGGSSASCGLFCVRNSFAMARYQGGEAPAKMLSSLGPAHIWIGLKNSDDVGLRVDLLVEVILGTDQVGKGQLDNVRIGSSGFNNAVLRTVSLDLIDGPVLLPIGSPLRFTVSARRTCSGPGHAGGTARLWYNGKATDTGVTRDASTRFAATTDDEDATFFLRGGQSLSETAGASRLPTDKLVNSKEPCPDRTFTPFGTWTLTVQ